VESVDLTVLTQSGRGRMTAPMINVVHIVARRRRIVAAGNGVRV
jgi:hypothetical protein